MNIKTKKILSYSYIAMMLCAMSLNTSSSIEARNGNFAKIDTPKTIRQESKVSVASLNQSTSSKVYTFQNIPEAQKVSSSVKQNTKKGTETQKTKKTPSIQVKAPATQVKPIIKVSTPDEHIPEIISDESKLVLNSAAEEIISDEAKIIEKEIAAIEVKPQDIVIPQKPIAGYDIPETTKTASLSSVSQKAEYISQTISDGDLEKLFHKNQVRFKNTSDATYNYNQFLSAWEAYSKASEEDGEEKILVLKKHFIESYFYLKGVEDKDYKESVRKSKTQKKTTIKANPQKRK